MDISLRERYRDIVFFETELDLGGRVKVDIPIIGGVDPGTDDEVYTAVGELADSNCWSGFVEDPVIGGQDLLNDVFGLFEVVFVRDANDHINAPCAVDGVVHYIVAGELCVWDDNADIVRSVDKSIEDANFLDKALSACCLDEITDFEWSKDNHKEAGSEICQCALECQTDGQASSTENDGKLRGLHAGSGEGGNHNKDQYCDVSEVLDELGDGFFDFGSDQGLFDYLGEDAGQPSSYEED